jgi:hypothetical protein
MRASNLRYQKPPGSGLSRLPVHEMSASENNSRAAMGPPPHGVKHKATSRTLNNASAGIGKKLTGALTVLEQSNSKMRKTLAERAGEPANPNPPVAPFSRNIHTNGNAKSNIPSTSHSRNLSASTSGLRLPSAPSRTNANPVSSNAVGRPPSAQSTYGRSQSALSHHSRSNSYNPTSRPGTAVNGRGVGSQGQMARASTQCTDPFSFPQEKPQEMNIKKLRACSDNSARTSTSASRPPSAAVVPCASLRSVSDTAQPLRGKSLQELTSNTRNQTSFRFTSLSLHMDSLSLVDAPSRPNKIQGTGGPEQTADNPFRSSIPIPSPKKEKFQGDNGSTVIPLGSLRPPSPQKSPPKHSPSKTKASPMPFLNRDSNVRAPLAANQWETEQRLAQFENFFETFKLQMEGTTFEKSSMKEMIEILRTRGKTVRCRASWM